jgi:6-phosphogluconolactonase (cycloisomerase 2 family)
MADESYRGGSAQSVPYATRRRRPSRRAVVLTILALAGLAGIAALLALRNWSGPTSRFDGYVYVESNRVRRNSVLAYRFADGRFRLLAEYPTGGRGAVDFGQSGALDADGQLAYHPPRRLLFAVNQGSDSVAVFHVGRDGTLTAAPGSPFPSGGKAPGGIGVAGDFAVVADKAQDASRDLNLVRPAYAVFRVGVDGRLAPVMRFLVDAGASPTQALVVGRVVAGTEEAGPFRSFTLDADGRLRQAPGSPLEPESSVFPSGYDGARWAIGLVPHPHRALLYADQAATAKLLVYSYDPKGRLDFVRAVRNVGAKLPCWTAVTPDGRRLYTANAGNGTVSAFDLSHDPMKPRHLQTLPLEHAGNPWGLALAPDGRTLFVVDPRAVAQVHRGRGNRLHALAIRSSGRLKELAHSPIRLPAGDDASPLGIAVVPRTG